MGSRHMQTGNPLKGTGWHAVIPARPLRALCLCGILSLTLVLGLASFALAQPTMESKAFYQTNYPRVETVLAQMCETAKQETRAMARTFGESRGVRHLDGLPRVCLDMEKDFPDPTPEIARMGGSVIGVYRDLGVVDLLAPPEAMDDLQALAGVRSVRLPRYVDVSEAGMHHGEGVNVIGGHDMHQAGRTGADHLVVVLDSGFDDWGVAQGDGDVPAPEFTENFRADGLLNTSVHGTGCAEVLYDVAPGVKIGRVAVSTVVEFLNAARWIRGIDRAGHADAPDTVEIVTCSLNWPYIYPQDGTCVLCSEVNATWAAGIFWSNSAGNYATNHWEAPWTDVDADTWLEFAPGDETMSFNLADSETIEVGIIWDEPWGGVVDDYDLRLYRRATGLVVASDLKNEVMFGGSWAFISYTVPAGCAGWYDVKVNWAAGVAPPHPRIELRASHDLEYQVADGSVACPANAVDAEAAGAMDYICYSAGGPLEDFSSRGRNNALVVKPDITAPDAVTTCAYGFRNEGDRAFTGTSAAAPHVAGAAAILMCDGSTAAQAKAQLHTLARMGDGQTAKPDTVYGHGLLTLGDVLARSTFSIAYNSTQVGAPRDFGPCDIIEEAWCDGDPYAVLKLHHQLLGYFLKTEEIDALSLNTLPDDILTADLLCFSVDQMALGVPGSAVAAEIAAPAERAECDIFHSIKNGTNMLTSDGDGSQAAILIGNSLFETDPLLDDLDALDLQDADPEIDWVVDDVIYYSVDPATAARWGISPAHIIWVQNSMIGYYAHPIALGLAVDDDIDALIVQDFDDLRVFDGADKVLFSLAPGSPTLAAIPATEGDVLTPGPAGLPVINTPAENLGLLTVRTDSIQNDNLNALDIDFDLWDPSASTDAIDRGAFRLAQNIPNPFTQATMIRFSLPQPAEVDLRIYDATGRLVRALAGGKSMAAGLHEAVWDGRNTSGRKVSAGIYFYQLRAGTLVETRRMVLIK